MDGERRSRLERHGHPKRISRQRWSQCHKRRLERVLKGHQLPEPSYSADENCEWIKAINFHINFFRLSQIAEHFAEMLHIFLTQSYSIDNLHLVGHSLGWELDAITRICDIFSSLIAQPFLRNRSRGQMVGKISRHLRKISNGTMIIPRIYALDPAGEKKKVFLY